MPDFPPHVTFIDLRSVREKLQSIPKFKILCSAIKRHQDICSIEADLRYARNDLDLCVEIAQVGDQIKVLEQNVVDARPVGALFFQALVLYTRATKSQSRHRGMAPIVDLYHNEFKQLHSKITEIRDDIFAHFGPGTDHAGGFWSREAIVLCVNDSGMIRISNPAVRTNYRQWAIQGLSDLIYHAYEICLSLSAEREQILVNQIGLLHNSSEFLDAIKLSAFDPKKFFTTEVAATEFSENFGKISRLINSLHPSGSQI